MKSYTNVEIENNYFVNVHVYVFMNERRRQTKVGIGSACQTVLLYIFTYTSPCVVFKRNILFNEYNHMVQFITFLSERGTVYM